MKQIITQKLVDRLVPGDRYYRIADAELPGFNVKVLPSGKIHYTLRYRLSTRHSMKEKIIAPASIVSAKVAKDNARLLLAKIWNGEDPYDDAPDESIVLISDLADNYMASTDFTVNRKSTRSAKKAFIERYLVPMLGKKPVTEVKRADIERLMTRISQQSGDGAARIYKSFANHIFEYAISEDIITSNPCKKVRLKVKARKKHRLLDSREIKILWDFLATIDDTARRKQAADVLRVALLTGQRSAEIVGMSWNEVDLEKREWIIPVERVKNKRAHVVYLTDPVLEILKRRREDCARTAAKVFGSTHRDAVRLHYTAASKLMSEPFTTHDLRRTMVSTLVKLNPAYTDNLLKRLINHVTDTTGALAHYKHHDYAGEKQAAFEHWARHVMSIVE